MKSKFKLVAILSGPLSLYDKWFSFSSILDCFSAFLLFIGLYKILELFVGSSTVFFIYTLGLIPGKAFIGDLGAMGFSFKLLVGVKLGLLDTLVGLEGIVTTC